jgi:hypothetical protein
MLAYLFLVIFLSPRVLSYPRVSTQGKEPKKEQAGALLKSEQTQ